MHTDLVVCGLGPAGRALAHRSLARGMRVSVVDPFPGKPWTATYSAWVDEVPYWLPLLGTVVAQPLVWTTRTQRVPRPYLVFDTAALQDALHLDGAHTITDRAVEVTANTVTLASGARLHADRVVDARGVRPSRLLAQQTAYGVVVEADHEPFFMDWRPDNDAGPGALPSFLYAVPTPAGTLLEETCLVGRPPLPLGELRRRLDARLRARGISGAVRATEKVRFAVTGGRPGRNRYGTAGAFVHPATGYSVAAALQLADASELWPPAARAVHALRHAGLRALLRMPPADVPEFFAAFFDLPVELQRAYLSERANLPGTAAAMRDLFAHVPTRLRTILVRATLAPGRS